MTLREATRVWLRIGLLSFGGPAGQIALMHAELVEKRRWISDERFLHALSFCTLLPGPEAMQLATYVGWLMHRLPGALVSGGLFVLPGALVLLALSTLYAVYGRVFAVEAVFFGLKAAVLALVTQALIRVGKRALKGRVHVAVAVLTFVALAIFQVPYPLLVLLAGIAGALLGRRVVTEEDAAQRKVEGDTLLGVMEARGELAHTRRTVLTAFACLAAWVLPLVAVALLLGPDSIWARQGRFFSEAALVTFGGAYAVLGYVAQAAVQTYGWLEPRQMIDGLALAETTPGPLILVLEFVGFVGAYQHAAPLSPFAAGALGAAVTLWATFAPCFAWILTGAPWVEALRGNARLKGALQLITAAVVGVIAQLSVWFALHVLFAHVEGLEPELASIQWSALGCGVLAFTLLFRFEVPLGWVLAACAAAGLLARLIAP